MSGNVKLLAVVGVALAGLLLGSAPAKAGDGCCYSCCPSYYYKPVTCYETVTCYKTCCEAYQQPVCCYDSCGCCCTSYKTCYRYVQVPYTKQVAYTKYCKIYY